MIIRLTVNGEEREARADGWESLLFLLRAELGLYGSKGACEQGECGSCSVVLDGDLVCSCLVMCADAHDSEVTTVEGIGSGDGLHPVQTALLEAGGVQCGFCTPGFVVAAAALFAENPSPDEADLREALSGNICRCTGYGAILRALTTLPPEGGGSAGGGQP